MPVIIIRGDIRTLHRKAPTAEALAFFDGRLSVILDAPLSEASLGTVRVRTTVIGGDVRYQAVSSRGRRSATSSSYS